MFDRFIRSNPLVFGALRGGLLAAAVFDFGALLTGTPLIVAKILVLFIVGAMTSNKQANMVND